MNYGSHLRLRLYRFHGSREPDSYRYVPITYLTQSVSAVRYSGEPDGTRAVSLRAGFGPSSRPKKYIRLAMAA